MTRIPGPKTVQLLSKMENLTNEAALELVAAGTDVKAADQVRVKYLGRRGLITEAIKAASPFPTVDQVDIGQGLEKARLLIMKGR